MFYRKYYSGKITSSSETSTILVGGKSVTRYTNQSKVICAAMLDFLKHCGYVNAVYEDSEGAIYPDKVNMPGIRIYLYFYSATVLTIGFGYYDINGTFTSYVISTSSGTSYQPFSGVDYKFYLTAKGDPESILRINIGSFSNVSMVTCGFFLGKGKDLRNNKDVALIFVSSSGATCNNQTYYPLYTDATILEKDTNLNTATMLITSTPRTLVGSIPLIQQFLINGVVKVNNCFVNPFNTSGENVFYMIDGVEYYCPQSYTFLKCPTKVS